MYHCCSFLYHSYVEFWISYAWTLSFPGEGRGWCLYQLLTPIRYSNNLFHSDISILFEEEIKPTQRIRINLLVTYCQISLLLSAQETNFRIMWPHYVSQEQKWCSCNNSKLCYWWIIFHVFYLKCMLQSFSGSLSDEDNLVVDSQCPHSMAALGPKYRTELWRSQWD